MTAFTELPQSDDGDPIVAFYNRHPYPPPQPNLDAYRNA
jgi:hypothetical protein